MSQETILIVEDERDLAATLEYNLKKEGYETRVAYNGRDALELANRNPRPHLVLLDLMLPDMSGIEVCRRLRASSSLCDISILMLTAKGEEIDRIVGFEVGADDYMVKPFSVRELLLRIRAVLRRLEPSRSASSAAPSKFGTLTVDESAHRAWVDEEEVVLTALEFKLLTTFLSRKGRVQTRETLLIDVWEMHGDLSTRTVDTHVKRLREKLGSASNYIETVRGVGYRFKANL